MTEIRWATTIATATAITESELKRHLEEAGSVFKTWKKFYPRGTEFDWTLYSARQDRGMVLVPNDQYQRVQTVKMKDQEPNEICQTLAGERHIDPVRYLPRNPQYRRLEIRVRTINERPMTCRYPLYIEKKNDIVI